MVNGSTPKATILIVDDIPDTVQLLRDWLEAHNFRTIGVTSSFQALEVAAQEMPDLILLDVMMPKMDGMETCRRLKANGRTSNIPVILVTAKNPSDARAEGMMAGAVDYITKPVNLADLVVRIENTLAATTQSPIDVQRLLEEVAHSGLTILSCELIWLLFHDSEHQVLMSSKLASTAGARIENDFLSRVANGQSAPVYSLQDGSHPFSSTFLSRKMLLNLPTAELKNNPETLPLYNATELLRLNYLTLVPLTVGGKTPGIMVLGTLGQHDAESPRARQLLTTLGTQAAIALDYSRLIGDLTEREKEMRREQNFRQMILDTMSDGLVVIDSKGTIKYVNRRLLRMTNFPRGYLENRSVGELFHPDDRSEVMIGLLREGAATMKFDQRLMTRENRVIPVWLTRSRAQSDDTNNQVIVLSDMTDQKRREAELERQTNRLQALNRAAHAITSKISVQETLNNILRSAMEVVDSQGASLFLINRENPNELIAVAAVGHAADMMQGIRVPVGDGIAGWVAREARSQIVADIDKDPRFYKGVDQQTGLNTQSLIAVPLMTVGRVIGVLEVVNKIEGTYDQDDIALLESMAGTAAVSIINARLFDETQRRVNELGTLLNASAAASSTLQFSQVLENIARNLSSGLDVARCTIMAYNATKNRLESMAEISDTSWAPPSAPARALADEPLTRAALSSGLPVLASLLETELPAEDRAALSRFGMISMMIVPLYMQNRIVGAAHLYSIDTQQSYKDHDAAAVDQMMLTWQQRIEDDSDLLGAGFQDLSDLAEGLLGVGRTCWVMLRAWRREDDTMLLLREMGFAEWTRRPGVMLPVEQFPTIKAVIQTQSIRMGTLAGLENDPGEVDWLVQRGGQAVMMVPLVERGTTVGIVKLVSQDVRTFEDSEVRLAQGIANVVSSAMENARLYQSLDSRARALESAYRELQEADRVKDEFIQNVSHELRTPLISVLGYGGLLAEGEFGSVNEQQLEALNTINQKAQQLAELVEDIVSVQALESRTYERKPLDAIEIVRSVLRKYTHRANDAGLRFNTQFPDGAQLILGDPNTIADAFERLVDNAIKFGRGGETVDIRVEDSGGPMLQFTVRDHGIGIDPVEHQKIFQRFYQVDGGTARRYAGTGLGLAIAKAIVEGHGGRIGVQSKLNEGATFFFTIPKQTTVSESS
ncbi:MAG: GAF domain-containing protein [Anaerolineae bacterium]|nr:GAF domain-containing protein [Anaerolineae bacterium]